MRDLIFGNLFLKPTVVYVMFSRMFPVMYIPTVDITGCISIFVIPSCPGLRYRAFVAGGDLFCVRFGPKSLIIRVCNGGFG